MTDIIRYCPNCGWDRPLAQHHSGSGCCPDVADGPCPEWFCLRCGAAVILDGMPGRLEPRREVSVALHAGGAQGRVA
jgi:hypothetical protein